MRVKSTAPSKHPPFAAVQLGPLLPTPCRLGPGHVELHRTLPSYSPEPTLCLRRPWVSWEVGRFKSVSKFLPGQFHWPPQAGLMPGVRAAGPGRGMGRGGSGAPGEGSPAPGWNRVPRCPVEQGGSPGEPLSAVPMAGCAAFTPASSRPCSDRADLRCPGKALNW